MNLGPWEILIIAVVIVLLFGARKMPAMARSLGQSMRILKAETKGMKQDDEQAEASAPTTQATQQPAQLPATKVDSQSQVDQMQKQIADLQEQLKKSQQTQVDQAHAQKNAS